jgi:hypothetical protein
MNHIQLHIIPEWYLLELAWFAARPLLRGVSKGVGVSLPPVRRNHVAETLACVNPCAT